jgi:hypothetical protein
MKVGLWRRERVRRWDFPAVDPVPVHFQTLGEGAKQTLSVEPAWGYRLPLHNVDHDPAPDKRDTCPVLCRECGNGRSARLYAGGMGRVFPCDRPEDRPISSRRGAPKPGGRRGRAVANAPDQPWRHAGSRRRVHSRFRRPCTLSSSPGCPDESSATIDTGYPPSSLSSFFGARCTWPGRDSIQLLLNCCFKKIYEHLVVLKNFSFHSLNCITKMKGLAKISFYNFPVNKNRSINRKATQQAQGNGHMC